MRKADPTAVRLALLALALAAAAFVFAGRNPAAGHGSSAPAGPILPVYALIPPLA